MKTISLVKMLSLLVLFPFVSSLIGCSTATPENINKLRIGSTTQSEAIKIFGKPESEDKFNEDNLAVTKTEYEDINWGNLGVVFWIDYQLFELEFTKDKLSGYMLICNHGKNATRFDLANLDQIEPGLSRDEVIKILGKPAGITTARTILTSMNDIFQNSDNEVLAYANAEKAEYGPSLNRERIVDVQLFLVEIGSDGKVLNKSTVLRKIKFKAPIRVFMGL